MSRRKTDPGPAVSRHQVPDPIPAAAPRAGLLLPNPEPDAVPPTWQDLDRMILDLCSRWGLHPVELVALRFGEPEGHTRAERFARGIHKYAGPIPGETLGDTLVRLGFATAEEAAWLDRGLAITEIKMHCHELIPLDRWDLLGYDDPGDIAPVQRLARFECVGNLFWRSSKCRVPELPKPESHEDRSDLLARAHRAVLHEAAKKGRALSPAQALAEAHDVVATLKDHAVMDVVVQMARQKQVDGGGRC